MGFPGGSVVKNLLANAGNAGDVSSTPDSRRSPGGGNGNPLQYSCLENFMDRGAWWAAVNHVTMSRTWDMADHTCTLRVRTKGALNVHCGIVISQY